MTPEAAYRDALNLLSSENNPRLYVRAASEFADFQFRHGDTAHAENSYREAIRLAEMNVRGSFSHSSRRVELAGIGDLYSRLAWCAFDRGAFEEAVGILEAGKHGHASSPCRG